MVSRVSAVAILYKRFIGFTASSIKMWM